MAISSVRWARWARLLLVSLLWSTAIPSSAALMLGHNVGFQWYVGGLNSPYGSAEVLSITPTDSLDLPGARSILTVSDDQVELSSYIDFTTSFTGPGFNGFVLTDIDGTISAFTGFEIDPITNLIGFDAARVTLAADSIAVNLQGLDLSPGMVLSLSVLSGESTSVPEPSTLALMLASFGALACATRRWPSGWTPMSLSACHRRAKGDSAAQRK
jgi:hypothetical protein